MTEALSANQLKIGYEKPISAELNMSFELGECVLVAGANGSGKSTLLKTLAGILPPLSGNIKLFGQSISTLKPAFLARQIAICLTRKEAPVQMKVRDIVELARSPYSNWLGRLNSQDNAAVDQAIELLDLSSLQNEPFNQLSDGQKQKVLLSRAIAQETKILLLDEPLSFLDRKNNSFFLNVIENLCKIDGRLVIFSAHELQYAALKANRAIVLEDEGALCEIYGENLSAEEIEKFL